MRSRFLVGTRFLCTKCDRRGVSPACACGRDGAETIDLCDPTHAALIAEHVGVRASLDRDTIFRDALASRTQWVASAVVSAVALYAIAGAPITSVGQAAAALGMFVLATLLVRIPMIAVALLLRLAVMLVLGVAAFACWIIGAIARSATLARAARTLGLRAEAVLEGDYLRAGVGLREGPFGDHQTGGALSSELRLVVADTHRGQLEIRDAEVRPFSVELASGEVIRVALDAGVIALGDAREEHGDAKMALPFIVDARSVVVAGGRAVTLRGGTWAETPDDPERYRDAERRSLRGTPQHPLEVIV